MKIQLGLIAGALAMTAAAAASPVASPSVNPGGRIEHLAIEPPANMVRRESARGASGNIDWLASGETVDDARRLVTIQRLSGLAGPEAPAEMLRGLATCFSPCPGQRVSEIDRTLFAGRPAARIRIDEPLNRRTGKPLTIFALAVSGERDLHTLTILIRGAAAPADVEFAENLLRSVIWCPAPAAASACASN